MKWVGYKSVAVKAIHVSGADEITRRQREAHVAELARSFRDATGGEPGNALWVTAKPSGGYQLVAGRDRFAATLVNGTKKAWVRIGEFNPRELLLAEVHENLRRRQDDRNALIARLVDETEAAAVPPPVGEQPAKAGRPKSGRQIAREAVAADTGMTTKAVARADEKAHAPARKAVEASAAAAPTIDMLGIEGEVSQAWLEARAATQAALDAVDRKLREAQGVLSSLMAEGTSQIMHCGAEEQARMQHLRAALHALGAGVRSFRPVQACAYCRDPGNRWGRRGKCSACGDAGYLTAEQAQRLPPEVQNSRLDSQPPVSSSFPGNQREGETGADAMERLERPAASAPREPDACAKCGGSGCGATCRYMDRSPAPQRESGWPAPKKPVPKAPKLQIQDDAGNELTVEPIDGAATDEDLAP